MTASPLLVLGSTGKTGRRIVSRLETLGQTVRHGSRRAPIPFDWHDRSTWAAALDGVTTVYVSYSPDLSVPGAVDTIEALTRLAAESGVRRLVLLTGRGDAAAERCERIVLDSAVPETTVVRAAWFMQNFTEGDFAAQVEGGEIALPVPADAVEPFVDVDDIADVAVAALTEPGHAGRIYALTGPRLMSWTEVAAELSTASGRTVRFVEVPREAFHAAVAAEAGEAFADLLTHLSELLADGRGARLETGVQDALGRAPRDFGEFLRRAHAADQGDAEALR